VLVIERRSNMPIDFAKMTDEEFDEILEQVVIKNANQLLLVPGAYELFSEYFNNEVLSIWEEREISRTQCGE
jgi:hypothetical protein